MWVFGMDKFEHYTQVVVDSKGRVLEVPLRRGVADSAFIDQISFRLRKESLCAFIEQVDLFESREVQLMLTDEQYVYLLSEKLNQIFGFGVVGKLDHKGGRFYSSCWQMGTENALYGRVHIGGQNNTILVEMTGTGCNAANQGWELRLHQFLAKCKGMRITRVDIAKDFFNGEYSPEQAAIDRLAGKFTAHRCRPAGQKVGTDWEPESTEGKGKTYYVGSRESSKFCRIYEKGKQLGDVNSNWVRFEIEFKAKDIVIPLDVLLKCGEYFGGAYPICQEMTMLETACRFDGVSKTLQTTYEKTVEVVKKQCGRAINAIIGMNPAKSAEWIIELIRNPEGKLPRRLAPENFMAEYYPQRYNMTDPTAV